MSLRNIVRRLGGDLYDGGRRANIPAPGHGLHDRSVSLLEQDGRVIVHTFGDGDWRAVRDHLSAHGLLPSRARGASGLAPASRVDRAGIEKRRAVARRLWGEGRVIEGAASERYLRRRGVQGHIPGSHVLRHHGLVPLSVYRAKGPTRQALLVGISDREGALTAVEIAYLSASGHPAAGVRLARKTVGVIPAGSAARLDPIAPDMLVAEGLVTTLSARARFALPAWALLSTSNLRFWTPPSGVRSVLIAADRGPDGEASAARLRLRLEAAGLTARIALPPSPFGDWNEAAVAQQASTDV
uniref:Virulence-associated protein E n=1 Tax=Caulobacter sp. (strain K31) TaxID=366602 RepID=B0T9F4_CAUSK